MSRELEVVMRPLHAPGHLPGTGRQPSPGAGWQRTALLPGPRPH
ncbi:hypothetical protein J2S50_006651 [Streptomyces sp. DSM 40167]|nr:hypothetical protein [Streptomyces sp. DSM 40167]